MIYKTVHPSELMKGDRVWHLGKLYTVARVSPGASGYFVGFYQGVTALFTSTVAIVDEDRTSAILARYE